MKTRILDALPVSREVLSTQEYMKLSASDRRHISETKIVAPKLGSKSKSKSFGGIEVIYKTPIYKIG